MLSTFSPRCFIVFTVSIGIQMRHRSPEPACTRRPAGRPSSTRILRPETRAESPQRGRSVQPLIETAHPSGPATISRRCVLFALFPALGKAVSGRARDSLAAKPRAIFMETRQPRRRPLDAKTGGRSNALRPKNRRLLPQADQPTWPWPNRRRRPPALVWPETAWILLSATMAVGQDRQITTPDRAALSKRLVPLPRGRGFRQPPLSGPSASLLDDDLPSFLADAKRPALCPAGSKKMTGPVNLTGVSKTLRFEQPDRSLASASAAVSRLRGAGSSRSDGEHPDSCRYDHSCRPYCQPWSLGRDISTKVL